MVDLHDVYRQRPFRAKPPGNVKVRKQFSCSGDAYESVAPACRRTLGAQDHTAIMAGMEADSPQSHIAHLTGYSLLVRYHEIVRHASPDRE